MRTAETKNGRKVTILEITDYDSDLETVPGAPFGVLLAVGPRGPSVKKATRLVQRLLKLGCGWATLFAGKETHRLIETVDHAVVDHQIRNNSEAEMGTSGEDGFDLAEAVNDAVLYGWPAYEEPYAELLALVIGDGEGKMAEEIESLVKTVESE